ncbi:hypothetical protein [Bacillus sp. MRMR6]|nr:hypothetical protein [Bacillus sp. MRMR6]
MESKEDQQNFTEIIKKAYEKGLRDQDATVSTLVADIEADLKKMLVG